MKLWSFIKKHFLGLFFVCFSLLYLAKVVQIGNKYQRFEKVINEDALGYYLILPAFFQYHDPQFEFIDSSLKKQEAYQHYFPPVVNTLENGKKVCKYYSGVALLQAPFYLTESFFFEQKTTETGFQTNNHKAILLASVTYLLLGFWAFIDILKRLNITPLLIAIATSVCLFGSNLLAYSSYDIAYSHVYSFFALVFFLRSAYIFKHKQRFWQAVQVGLFYGLILIIRPLNGIAILFLPLLFSWEDMLRFFKSKHLYLLLLIIACTTLMIGIQLSLWHWQTGQWYVYPYGNEKLDLSHPQLYDLVFSYNCGWAVYSPLPFTALIVSIIGLVYKRKWRQATWAVVLSLSILYLLSSWYYLHYGCTVGCRPITEFYGPLFILFCVSTQQWFNRIGVQLTFSFFSMIGIYFNLVMHHQFFENIINWCEMDKERAKMVFLKTHEAYKYASSPFWDFSRFDGIVPFKSQALMHPMQINKNKVIDQYRLELEPFENRDSSVLFNLHLKGKMKGELNDSYLRILIHDDGAYIELLNLLLLRKMNQSDKDQSFIYQFHVSKPIKKPILDISLESVNEEAETDLLIERIDIKRIQL